MSGPAAPAVAASAASAANAAPAAFSVRACVLVVLLALIASAPSLANGFAYDDHWIIVTNPRVHDLAHWIDWFRTAYWPTAAGSLYRPLTTAGFALQWAIGGGEPWVFHVANVVLYAGGAAAFFWLASLLLPRTAAIVAGALFAVHPVHVEAVGNVVGQSELSAGLVMLVATAIYVTARRAGGPARQQRLLLALCFFAGVLFKEHAMVLPAWFLMLEATVLRNAEPLRARVRTLAPLFTMMFAIAVFALVVRWDVLDVLGGDVPHPSLLDVSRGERLFIMLGVLPELARVLLWPAKLFADYSPAHIVVSPVPDPSQLNGVLILVGVIALLAVAWRRSAVAACGLLIAIVTWLPTANILFPSGVLLAERAMYLPSAGVLLAIGVCVAWIERRTAYTAAPPFAPSTARAVRTAAAVALGVLLVAGMVKSIDRQHTWRSSDDLFLTMMREQPLSFRAHYAWGGILFERGDLAGGEREWRMALRILPTYHMIHQDLAGQYASRGFCGPAIPMFQRAIELGGRLPRSRAGIVLCELALGQFRAARRTARLGMLDGNDWQWFRVRRDSAQRALAATDSLP